MSDINPYELNKRISFYSVSQATTANNVVIKTRTLVYTCWAKFARTSGTEAIKANADFADIKVRFLIRHTKTPLDRKMVIVYNNNDYEITYMNDYGDANKFVEIIAERITLKGA